MITFPAMHRAKLNASVTGLHYKQIKWYIRNYWFVSYTSIKKTQFDRAKEQIKLRTFCFIEKQNKQKKKRRRRVKKVNYNNLNFMHLPFILIPSFSTKVSVPGFSSFHMGIHKEHCMNSRINIQLWLWFLFAGFIPLYWFISSVSRAFQVWTCKCYFIDWFPVLLFSSI